MHGTTLAVSAALLLTPISASAENFTAEQLQLEATARAMLECTNFTSRGIVRNGKTEGFLESRAYPTCFWRKYNGFLNLFKREPPEELLHMKDQQNLDAI